MSQSDSDPMKTCRWCYDKALPEAPSADWKAPEWAIKVGMEYGNYPLVKTQWQGQWYVGTINKW